MSVAVGSSVQFGTKQTVVLTMTDPTGINGQPVSYEITAGDETVFAVDIAGVTQATLDNRAAKFASNNASENLQTVGLMFWYLHDTNDQFVAAMQKATAFRLPSLGAFGSPLVTSYFFGIPRSAAYKGRYADVKRVRIAATANDGLVPVAFMKQSGLQGSDFEGLSFDLSFNRVNGTSGSATRLIDKARNSGLSILKITSNNVDVLQTLSIPEEVKTDIQNAIATGKEAIVPENVVTSGSWKGIGYVLTDPTTGAGAYMINGGYNGGVDEPGCDDGTATAPVTSEAALGHFSITDLIAFAVLAYIAAPAVIGVAIAVALSGMGMLAASAPAMAGQRPPGGQMSGRLIQVWNNSFGKVFGDFPLGPNYPGTGIEPPGECGQSAYDQLKGDVDGSCRKPMDCKGNECDSNVLSERVGNRNACIQARIDMMVTCFKGGDQGHWRVVEDHLRGLADCHECIANLSRRQCRK